VTDREEAGTTPFEQVKDDIVAKLAGQQKGKAAQEYIASLRAKANVKLAPGTVSQPSPPGVTAGRPSTPPRSEEPATSGGDDSAPADANQG
jgi:hypothetical protein